MIGSFCIFLKLVERLLAKTDYLRGKCCVGDLILRLKCKRKGNIIRLCDNVFNQLKTKVVFYLTKLFAQSDGNIFVYLVSVVMKTFISKNSNHHLPMISKDNFFPYMVNYSRDWPSICLTILLQMKSFCATKIHEYLHHLDLLGIITIESPCRTTEISVKFHQKEEKRRQKQ